MEYMWLIMESCIFRWKHRSWRESSSSHVKKKNCVH